MVDYEKFCVTNGDYVITAVMNAFNDRTSFWISKRGYADAYYCFSANRDSDVKEQLENWPGYIRYYELSHARTEWQTEWDDCIQFEIGVYDRALLILYNGGCEEREKIDDVLKKRYDEWLEPEDDAVRCACCEEYLLEGVAELGIKYKAVYIGGDD